MPQKTKSKNDNTNACEFGHRSLITSEDPTFQHAIEAAVHFRGDVTLTCFADGTKIEGYIFDLRMHDDPAKSCIRMISGQSSERLTILLREISELEFSGRDTAAGKSFETWMKKYVEKKLSGQDASIHADSLEEA